MPLVYERSHASAATIAAAVRAGRSDRLVEHEDLGSYIRLEVVRTEKRNRTPFADSIRVCLFDLVTKAGERRRAGHPQSRADANG